MKPRLLLIFHLCWITLSSVAAPVDFEKQIRPILAESCLLCHGTDDSKGGLRLNSVEGATKTLKGGGVGIIPGAPERSEVIKRIVSKDPEKRMPPADHDMALSSEQIALLEQWIAEGAEYQEHWAYRPLEPGAIPSVSDVEWTKSPIDFYVLKQLDDHQASPSSQASDSTLLRRLHLDLTGLPPSPEEIQSFTTDTSEQALESAIDALLSSPHFGERWGRHWLDKARYADSDGYEKDRIRPNAWRYRDWVIDAINNDMPIDQFTIEQLAGDLLPDASESQKLATAFNRQTLTNTEGGTDKEQWRIAAIMDRTETLGSVWLGLTVGCARCHNHKYDALTQAEYYQIFAYFNNGDETNTKVRQSDEEWDAYLEAKLRNETTIEELTKEMADISKELTGGFGPWLENAADELEKADVDLSLEAQIPMAVYASGKAVGQIHQDGSVVISGTNPDKATTTLRFESLPQGTRYLTLSLEPDSSFKKKGPGRAPNGNLVLTGFQIFAGKDFKDAEKNKIDITSSVSSYHQKKFPAENAIDNDHLKSGWALGGNVGKTNQIHFVLAEEIESSEKIVIRLHQNYGGQHTIGRFRILASPALPLDLTPQLAESIISKKITKIQKTALKQHYFLVTSPDYKRALDQRNERFKNTPKPPLMDVRVISERKSNPRSTHVLRRGEFKEPEEEVIPLTPAFLPSTQENEGTASRLDLAQWLVGGRNPLPPRVIVNQIWANLFGEGLVRSMNDFGVRGDRPTHPALLDWLASRLIELKWSRKALIKEIVMSATYQQSSATREQLLETDPQNKLLHRQNRYRLEAEILRDAALVTSGLLDRRVGGQSVFPLMPKDVAALNYNSSFKWVTSTQGNQHRRGLYTFFKRTAPHPNLTTFDCPDSNVTCVQRNRSNTPLGALTMLNNGTFTEAAESFALRVIRETGGIENRIQFAFQAALARTATKTEIDALTALYSQSLEHYSKQSDDALALLTNKDAPESERIELAAWTATLRVVLNLDEFITRE